MKEVLLVDASNLARRNFHGQSLCTSTGVKTGLIYGVINSLISVQGDVQADEVVVVWDMPGSSDWRKAIYPLYKAGRTTPESDYLVQREFLEELLTAMGVAQAGTSLGEADDVIGFLAKEEYADCKVSILSGDHDFYSQIEDRIHVISPISGLVSPGKDGRVPIKNGAKIINLLPNQVVDYKCLVGDASDNIPGAPNFGIGAAITYFSYNNSIQPLIDGTANLKGITSRAAEGLLAVRPMLKTFKKLVTINPEIGKVPTPVRPPVHKAKVEALFNHFEFNQFKVRGDMIYKIAGK